MDATALVDGLRRDAERSLFRARNGIKLAVGASNPPVGLTPKHAVWQRDKATLWRYDGPHGQGRGRGRGGAGRRPIVICFSIMGRPYVLDLRPGNSFVERLLAAGEDVYLLDFGVPDDLDAHNTLETYSDGYVPRAIRAAVQSSGADDVDLLGYCFGGVLATLAVAGNPDLPVATLAAMATPIDFSQMTGIITVLVDGRLDIDDVVDHTGNVPAESVHRMFRSLKPTAGISAYATLWEKMWSDEFVDGFQAMSQWARDQVPFPGATARQGLELLLQQNLLLTGEIPLGDRTVALADITCPVMAIVAEHDHIVSPDAALPLLDIVGGDDVEELRIPAGHIGLATGRQAVKTTIPELTRWLTRHRS